MAERQAYFQAQGTLTVASFFIGQAWANQVPHLVNRFKLNRVLKEDFSGINFTFKPKYNPNLKELGLATRNTSTQIGPRAFTSRTELRDTILEEEYHHRMFKLFDPPHHPHVYNIMMEPRIKRYFRMRNWERFE